MEGVRAHEPEAELLSPGDVDKDVASLSEALAEKRAERIAHNVLMRSDVRLEDDSEQELEALLASFRRGAGGSSEREVREIVDEAVAAVRQAEGYPDGLGD